MLVKILVVDDDLEVLDSLGKIFTTLMKGYLVLNATSANAGLSMLKEQRPDIVIVDVRLGPASGMDLISDYYQWINERGGYIPIFIVITAYDDAAAKKKAEEFKVDAFLMKPFSKEVILHAVIDGVCKVLHQELNILDEMRNHYKMLLEKISTLDKKLNADKEGNREE
jgi:CheY-like chemotaxis protein